MRSLTKIILSIAVLLCMTVSVFAQATGLSAENTRKSKILLQDGVRYLRAKDYRSAKAMFEEALIIYGNKKALRYLDKLDKELKKAAKKERQRRVFARNGKNGGAITKSEEYYADGLRYYEKGDYIKAKVRFEQAMDMFSENEEAETYIFLTRISLARLGITEDEIDKKEREAKRYLLSVDFYREGEFYFKEGEYQEAKIRFEKALDVYPENKKAEVYLMACINEIKQGAQTAQDILRSRHYYDEGLEYYKQGYYAEAKESFKKALEIYSGNKKAEGYFVKAAERAKSYKKRPIEIKDSYSISGTDEAYRRKVDKRKMKKRKEADNVFASQDLSNEGIDLYKAGKYEEAKIRFKEALEVYSGNKEAKRYLDWANKRIKGKEKESRVVKRFQALYKEGIRYYKRGKYNKARGRFEEALEVYPDNKEAESYLDRVDGEIKKIAEMKKNLTKSEELLDEGIEYYKNGNNVRAQVKFEEALEYNPGNSEAQGYLDRIKTEKKGKARREKDIFRSQDFSKEGVTYFERGNYEFAKERFEEALNVYPENKKAKRYLERVQVELKKVRDEKEKILRSQALFNEGIDHFERGDRESAKAKLIKALELYPDNKGAGRYLDRINNEIKKGKEEKIKNAKVEELLGEGIEYYMSDDYVTAKTKFKEVLIIKPGHKEAREYLGRAKIEINNKIEEERRILKSQNLYNKGMDYYNREDFDTAKVKFEQALEIYPWNNKAELSLGMAVNEIKAKQERIIKSRALYGEGVDYFRNEDFVRAVAKFEEALDVYPDNEDAAVYLERAKDGVKEQRLERKRSIEAEELFNEGIDYFLNEDYAEAKLRFEEALEVNPDYIEVKEYLYRANIEIKNRREEERRYLESQKLYKEGVDHYNKGDLIKAKAGFEEALDTYPWNDKAGVYLESVKREIKEVKERSKKARELYKEGVEYYNKGDFVRAEAKFEESLENYSDKKKILRYIDDVGREIKKKREQKRRISRSEELFNEGIDYYLSEDYAKAKEKFRKSLDMYPENEGAKNYLERINVELKNKVEEDKRIQRSKDLYKKAMNYYLKKELNLAKNKLEEALDLYPWNKKAREQLETVIREIGRREDRAVRAKALYAEGRDSYREKNYERAKEKFFEALDIDPGNAEAREYLEKTKRALKKRTKELERIAESEELLSRGMDHYSIENYEKAKREFKRALDIYPWNDEAKEYLAKAEEKMRENARHRRTSRKSLGLYEEGMDYYKDGDLDKAREKFIEALDVYPENRKAEVSLEATLGEIKSRDRKIDESNSLYEKGLAYYRRENYRQAKEKFLDALDAYPENKEAQAYLERVNQGIKKKADEEKRLSESKELFNEGKRYFRDRDYFEAKAKFEEALDVYPWDEEVKDYLERANERIKRETENKRKIRRSEELYREGMGYYTKENFSKARDKFEEALDIYPLNKKAEISLETTLKEMKATGKRSETSDRIHEEGMEYYRSEEFEKAKEKFEEALEENPLNKKSDIYLEITLKEIRAKRRRIARTREMIDDAVSYYKRGDYEESERTFRDVIRLDPENAEAKKYLLKLTRKLKKKRDGRREEAWEMESSFEKDRLRRLRAIEEERERKGSERKRRAEKELREAEEARRELKAAREKRRRRLEEEEAREEKERRSRYDEELGRLKQEKVEERAKQLEKLKRLEKERAEAGRLKREKERKELKKKEEVRFRRGAEKIERLKALEAQREKEEEARSKRLKREIERAEWEKAEKEAQEELLKKTRKEKMTAEKIIASQRLFSDGVDYYTTEEYEIALEKFEDAVSMYPGNEAAKMYIHRTKTEMDKVVSKKERIKRSRELCKEGKKYYKKKYYLKAKKRFEEALRLDRTNETALKYLIKVNKYTGRGISIREIEEEVYALEEEVERGRMEEEIALERELEERLRRAEKEERVREKEALRISKEKAKRAKVLRSKLRKEKKRIENERKERQRVRSLSRLREEDSMRAAKEEDREKDLIQREKELRRKEALRKERREKKRKKSRKLEEDEREEELSWETEELERLEKQTWKEKKRKRKREEKARKAKEAKRKKQEKKDLRKSQQLVKQGLKFYKKGELRNARESFEEALDIYPDNTEAQKYFERTISEIKEREESIIASQALFGEGVDHYKEKEYDEARKKFKKAIVKYPGNKKAGQYIRMVERAIKERDERIEASDALTSESVDLYRAKYYEKAKRKLEEALEVYPENKKAKTYLKEVTSGIKERKNRADRSKKLTGKGKDLYAKSKYVGARIKFEDALDVDPENKEAELYLARIDEKVKLEITNEKRIKHSKDLLDSGVDFYNMGDFKKAKDRFEGALDVDPDNREAEVYLETVIGKIKRQDEEVHKVTRLFTEAMDHYRSRRYDKAKSLFEAILDLDPEHEGAERYLVRTERKRKEERIKVQRKAERRENLRKIDEENKAEKIRKKKRREKIDLVEERKSAEKRAQIERLKKIDAERERRRKMRKSKRKKTARVEVKKSEKEIDRAAKLKITGEEKLWEERERDREARRIAKLKRKEEERIREEEARRKRWEDESEKGAWTEAEETSKRERLRKRIKDEISAEAILRSQELFSEAIDLYTVESYHAAEEKFEEALDAYPWNEEAKMYVHRCKMQIREAEEERARIIESRDLYKEGVEFYRKGLHIEAKVTFEEAIRLYRGNTKAVKYLMKVNRVLEKNKTKEAIDFETRLRLKEIEEERRMEKEDKKRQFYRGLQKDEKRERERIKKENLHKLKGERGRKAAELREHIKREDQAEKEARRRKVKKRKTEREARRKAELKVREENEIKKAEKMRQRREKASRERIKLRKEKEGRTTQEAEEAKRRKGKARKEREKRREEKIAKKEKDRKERITAKFEAKKQREEKKKKKLFKTKEMKGKESRRKKLRAELKKAEDEETAKRKVTAKEKKGARPSARQVDKSNRLFGAGLRYYKDKNFVSAKVRFQEALTVNPENKKAKKYLEKTNKKIRQKTKSLEKLKIQEKEKQGAKGSKKGKQKISKEDRIKKSGELTKAGVRYLKAKGYQEAKTKFEEALMLYSGNKKAKAYLKDVNKEVKREVTELRANAIEKAKAEKAKTKKTKEEILKEISETKVGSERKKALEKESWGLLGIKEEGLRALLDDIPTRNIQLDKLTLDDCMNISLKNNIQIENAKKQVKLAKMRLWEAKRNLGPKLKAKWEESGGRIQDREYVGRKILSELSQPIFHGGELYYTMEQAKVNLEIVQNDFERVKNGLILQVQKAYYSYDRAIKAHKLQEKLYRRADTLNTITKKGYKVEAISKIEYLNVTSKYNQVNFQFISAKEDVLLAKLILQQAMNMEDDINIVLVGNPTIKEISLDDCYTLAFSNRPEMKINFLMAEYYLYEKKIIGARGLPQVDFLGSWGYAYEDFVEEELTRDQREMETEWYAGVKVRIPFFGSTANYSYTTERWQPVVSTTHGTESTTHTTSVNILDNLGYYSDITEADIGFGKMQYEYNKVKQEITLEVKEVFFRYKKAILQMQVAKSKVKYQSKQVEFLEAKRELNDAPAANVLEELIKLGEEEFSFIQAISDYYIAIKMLNKAVGIRDYF